MLATSIAETSLTIEGVRVVIDSGLMRAPRFEPDLGLTRLETVRVSRANADQRRGRAGRIEPGICYRLWEEAANGGLAAFAAPEILAADLSGLALDLAIWGVADPAALRFLDPPPRAAFAEARALLTKLGALDAEGRVTDEGRAVAGLALPPRLARMLVDAASRGRGAGGGGDRDAPQRARPRRRRGRPGRAAGGVPPRPLGPRRGRAPAGAGAGAARAGAGAARRRGEAAASPGVWLARAFPERIARARGARGEFLMANGRAGAVEPHDALARETFLAVGELAGRAGAQRILLAAPLTLDEIEAIGGAETVDETTFDRAAAALRRRRRRRLGALTLAEQTLPAPTDDAAALILARGVLAPRRRAAAVDARRSRNGATASRSCAAPSPRSGPTSPTKRSPPRRTGSRPI